jgi:hypothetical protein
MDAKGRLVLLLIILLAAPLWNIVTLLPIQIAPGPSEL